MIQISFVIVVFGVFRASFDACIALDAYAGKFAYVIMTDGTHRAYIGAQHAVVAVIICLRLYLPDIYPLAVPVTGRIVRPV